MLHDPQAEWAATIVRRELARRVRLPLPLWRLEPADRADIVQRVAQYTPTAVLYRDAERCESESELVLFVGKLAGRYDTEREEMINALDDDPSSQTAAAVHAGRAAIAVRILAALDVRNSVQNVDVLFENILQTKEPAPL